MYSHCIIISSIYPACLFLKSPLHHNFPAGTCPAAHQRHPERLTGWGWAGMSRWAVHLGSTCTRDFSTQGGLISGSIRATVVTFLPNAMRIPCQVITMLFWGVGVQSDFWGCHRSEYNGSIRGYFENDVQAPGCWHEPCICRTSVWSGVGTEHLYTCASNMVV